MNLHRFSRLELPEYPPGTVVLKNKIAYMNAQFSGQTQMVREVCIPAIAYYSNEPLPKLLEHIDNTFENAASHCGALVVGHTWGLYHLQHDPFYDKLGLFPGYAPCDGMPADCMLVAEVDVIKNALPIQAADHNDIIHGIARHLTTHTPYIWADPGIGQFIEGVGPDSIDRERYLIDIDPIVRDTRNDHLYSDS